MKFITNFAFCLLLYSSCNRKAGSSTTQQTTVNPSASAFPLPACIQQKIDSIKKEKTWNPPAEINEYDYNSRKVYLISAPCCDFYITAVDANCNYVCSPSGGLTGKGDRKCEDFNTKAKFLRLVWKDERKAQ